MNEQFLAILSQAIALICKSSRKCVIKPKPVPSEIDIPKNLEDFPQFLRKYYKEHYTEIKDYRLVDLMKLIIKYTKTQDDIVLDAIYKIYTKFDTSMKVTYDPKSLSPQQLVVDLMKLTGSDEIILPFMKQQELKRENPVLFEQYKEYVKLYMIKLKKAVSSIFSKFNNQPIPLSVLNRELQKLGFIPIYENIENEFLYVDNSLRLLLRNSKYLKCNVPLYSVEIVWNDDYRISRDNAFVLKFRTKGATVWQYCYTVDFKLKQQRDVYRKIRRLLEHIQDFRKRWLRDIDSSDSYIRQIAILVELAYLTAGRIGTKGNRTQGKETYGLSTLKKKHIKIKDDVILITYIGKGGVKQSHVIRDKKLAEALKKLLNQRKDNDQVFEVNGDMINKYLQQKIGLPITIHKFRKLRGTELVYREIEKVKCKKFKSDKDIFRYIKQLLTQAGEVLGHISGEKVTYTTALKNYVDPKVLELLFVKCGYPIPKAIQQLSESTFDEIATSASISPAVSLNSRATQRVYYPENLLEYFRRKFFKSRK